MALWLKLSGESEAILLRQQIAEQKQMYDALIARLQIDYDDRVKFLRDRYEDEVKYLRERVKTVEQEQERLTLFLHPNLNRVSTRAEIAAADEDNQKNREQEPVSTTPFQRIAARLQEEDRKQREEAKRQFELRKLKEEEEKEKKDKPEAVPQTAA